MKKLILRFLSVMVGIVSGATIESKEIKKVIAIICIALGLISGVLFFSAGSRLSKSGMELTGLKSISGGTVNEFYYQEIGHYGIAYSLFAYALGTGIIMVSIGFGCIILLRE